ncbi:MAG TPA: hypothetical protein VLU24_07565 [Mycobacterium sp.]|nr:hypothetical protein [Mycobacterium sp.]
MAALADTAGTVTSGRLSGVALVVPWVPVSIVCAETVDALVVAPLVVSIVCDEMNDVLVVVP